VIYIEELGIHPSLMASQFILLALVKRPKDRYYHRFSQKN